jgi:hypothetical protein
MVSFPVRAGAACFATGGGPGGAGACVVGFDVEATTGAEVMGGCACATAEDEL